jgi:hypothetical protein
MTYALLPAIPALLLAPPPEAALVLALGAALVALAALGPVEAPPSAEVTSAAIFAMHGHV